MEKNTAIQGAAGALWNKRQVARYLAVSWQTLDRWIKNGGGPKSIKLGSLVRFRESDVHEFVERSSRTGAAA
jgi:excisionase family DNA binding protein